MSRDRYDRLQTLKREAAAQFELPESAERVAHIAALRMHHEALQERLCAGKPVETSDLLSVSRAIADLSPVVPQHLNLQIVRDVVDICPKCHWSRPAADKPEPEPPSPSPPRTDPPSPPIEKPAPAAPSMLNIVPIRGPRSIHDDGAPLAQHNEPWRGHVGQIIGQSSHDPFPTPDAPPPFPTPKRGA
jgi:hypothetical protein